MAAAGCVVHCDLQRGSLADGLDSAEPSTPSSIGDGTTGSPSSTAVPATRFGTIDVPCLTYVSPAAHLSSRISVAEVTCLHMPSWCEQEVFDEAERQPIRVYIGCSDGVVLEYIVGHSIETEDRATVLGHHGDVVSCIFSSRSRWYSCSHDGTMIEWTPSGKHVHTFEANKGPLLTILGLEDETYTGSASGAISAFHAYNRSLLRCFQISSAPVLHLCSYSKTMIVSGSADGHVILWQRMDGYPSRVLRSTTCAVSSLAVHTDGYAFASTHANLASLPPPEEDIPFTAQDIKGMAEQRRTHALLGGSDSASMSLISVPECLSWDLTTGWKEHKFPADTTCLILHDSVTPEGLTQVYLISGHQDGAVRVWLTSGRSEDTITAGKLLQKWNNELAEAEAKLEELRQIEEREADIALAAKNARRPYFGLSLLLTASLEGDSLDDRLTVGMGLLEVSSKPDLHRPEATPALNVLFRNSVDYSPELLWSGLFVLNRHVIAEEMAPSITAKDNVDQQREIIARIRERATEADRSITDLLAKGQLLKTMSALTQPVTALAAHGSVLFGSCEGTIAGWDLRTGRHREAFTNVDGVTRNIILKDRIMCAINSKYGVSTWYSHLLAGEGKDTAQSGDGAAVVARRAYTNLPQQVVTLLPDMAPARPCLAHSSPLPDAALHEEDLAVRFAKLQAHEGDTTVSLPAFSAMWNSLEHCGVNPHPTEATLAAWLRLPQGCTRVTYPQFASCMLRYTAR